MKRKHWKKITNIDNYNNALLRIIANAGYPTGRLDGQIEKEGGPHSCTISGYRKNMEIPVSHVYWLENKGIDTDSFVGDLQ